MSLNVRCSFKLNAVIQLIHEYDNRPLIRALPKIYTSCPVEIIRKENGIYAFVNAKESKFNVRIELPQYIPETMELTSVFQNTVQMIRCSPVPSSILGAPPANVTYFCGKGQPGEKIYLQCPVGYCRININKILDNGRVLFESTNFLFAGTGRSILLKDKNGKCELIRTTVEKAYASNRLFLSEYPLSQIEFDESIIPLPVFCSRADENGIFLIAAEEAIDGTGILLKADGTEIKSFTYKANGRVDLS